MTPRPTLQSGFTIAEMLVALGVLAVLLGLAGGITIRSHSGLLERLRASDDFRNAWLADKELRMRLSDRGVRCREEAGRFRIQHPAGDPFPGLERFGLRADSVGIRCFSRDPLTGSLHPGVRDNADVLVEFYFATRDPGDGPALGGTVLLTGN